MRDTGKRAVVATVKRRSKILASFVSLQIVVQVLSLLSGLLVVRSLGKTEYAYFTIANTMQATLSVLADSGITSSVLSIGGKSWNDRHRLGQVVNSALQLRTIVAAFAVAIVGPLLIWLMVSNGAAPLYACLLLCAVLIATGAQLTTGVLEVIPRLHSEIGRMAKLDLAAVMTRLALLVIGRWLFLNAAIAVLAASLGLLLKNSLLRQLTRDKIDKSAPVSREDQAQIFKIVKQQAPNSIFFCIQGQLAVWLISIFGNTRSIAEVGALARLTVLFTIANSVLSNIALPRFARCQQKNELQKMYAQILGTYFCLSLFLMSLALFAPQPLLWLLGGRYSHLTTEFKWMVFGTLINAAAGVLFGLNLSRGWVQGAWLSIPITICVQVALIPFLDLSSIVGVILVGSLPNLPVAMLFIYRALHSFKSMEVVAN